MEVAEQPPVHPLIISLLVLKRLPHSHLLFPGIGVQLRLGEEQFHQSLITPSWHQDIR